MNLRNRLRIMVGKNRTALFQMERGCSVSIPERMSD